MLLKGRNGNEFELGFTRDSLPDAQDGFGDSRWATVTYRAATADAAWEESSPAINMFEFANLADWLESVGNGGVPDRPEMSEVELLAPELKFTVSQQNAAEVTVRIAFHLDSRPEEFSVDASTDEADYVDIHVSRTALLAASRVLRTTLQTVEAGTGKDDLHGESDPGVMGDPDEGLNIVDRIEPYPPGAGTGEDNAGQR